MTIDSEPWLPLAADAPRRWMPGFSVAVVGRFVRAICGEMTDLVLPPACPVCRARLGSTGGLCTACWQSLRFLERPWCERLGTPLPIDLGPGILSAAAVADPPAFARARSAVSYEGPVPDLVHALKYADRTDLAPMLGAWMARAAHELVPDADMLIPVPLHWGRLASRRFNQAALLAHQVGRLTGLPVAARLLLRTRRTPQQVGLGRDERARNMRGAFIVPESKKADLAGRRPILIDDVLTTGATLEAATRALLAAGAPAVDVLTLARVVAPS
ncbi:ComF family protein [Pleomorphomonas sp. PLEO]|uniref:ComF family protein n=1 Tax=Pleomorphomonas sp. PLEO TaxID=3239306 RepID=UPI00351DBBD0